MLEIRWCLKNFTKLGVLSSCHGRSCNSRVDCFFSKHRHDQVLTDFPNEDLQSCKQSGHYRSWEVNSQVYHISSNDIKYNVSMNLLSCMCIYIDIKDTICHMYLHIESYIYSWVGFKMPWISDQPFSSRLPCGLWGSFSETSPRIESAMPLV